MMHLLGFILFLIIMAIALPHLASTWQNSNLERRIRSLMTFTRHGHHIPGTVLGDEKPRVARCGGPGLCPMCSMEAQRAKKDILTEPTVVADYQLLAKVEVVKYFNDRVEMSDESFLSVDNVYVVWFSTLLKNWKAVLSTTLTDGLYYEVTHDGIHNITYIDAYKKLDHVSVAG